MECVAFWKTLEGTGERQAGELFLGCQGEVGREAHTVI